MTTSNPLLAFPVAWFVQALDSVGIEFGELNRYAPDLPDSEITDLLREWSGGDDSARDRLIELTYPQLRAVARNRLRAERGQLSLDSRGLAHEAFEKLIGQSAHEFEDRGHFFSIVAMTMRRLMIDKHRAETAKKRGGGAVVVSLSVTDETAAENLNFDGLNRALDRLAKQDPRQAQIVELRFFGGLTIEETAEAIETSAATVKRDWAMARAYLKRELVG